MSPTHRFDVAALLCRYDNDTAVMAEQIGVSHRTVNRWVFEGGIPEEEADRVAIACGSHPIVLWGDEWVTRYEGDTEQLGLFDPFTPPSDGTARKRPASPASSTSSNCLPLFPLGP